MTTQFRCLDTGTLLTVARRNFRRVERIDEYPDTSWLDDDSGRERLVAFREGTWHLMGIQASANVLIPLCGHSVTQTVTSPGLFGIESDSDEAYLDQVFAEECASLTAMLSAIGITVTE
jgi:hypothetical protein